MGNFYTKIQMKELLNWENIVNRTLCAEKFNVIQ